MYRTWQLALTHACHASWSFTAVNHGEERGLHTQPASHRASHLAPCSNVRMFKLRSGTNPAAPPARQPANPSLSSVSGQRLAVSVPRPAFRVLAAFRFGSLVAASRLAPHTRAPRTGTESSSATQLNFYSTRS